MSQRDEITRKIAKAATLKEQIAAVAELDAYDRQRHEASVQARSVDWAATTVGETLRPVATHERSTHETDWLGEISTTASAASEKVTVEASMWYRRLTPEVKADREEFAEQARGMARRTASAHGEHARAMETEFLQYVAFLHSREAASGLPQVQQEVDSFENPAPQSLPEQTFDNFAPPVAPINQGVSGTETSANNPLINLLMQEGGSPQGAPTHHDEVPQPYTYAEVPPGSPQDMQAQAMFTPTVAINHSMTLDDFRRQAASGLDQVQQVVDSFEEPDETPLNPEVAFPWEISPDATGQASAGQAPAPGVNPSVVKRREAVQRRAAYVASLAMRDPATLTPAERQEVLAFTASLQRTADQWSQSGPQYKGPSAQNSPATTPDAIAGDYAAGYAEGRTDWPGEAPDFADASPSIPPYAEGHAIGYQDAAHANPTAGAAQPDALPPGAGGVQQGYQTKAGSLQTQADALPYKNPQPYADNYGSSEPVGSPTVDEPETAKEAAREVQCASCGKTDKAYNMKQRGTGSGVQYTCTNCSPVASDPAKVRWQGSLKVSASFVAPIDAADPDFTKGYKYATKWTPGTRLVTTGSAAFEAGLYAGMSDNAEHQGAWVAAHRKQAAKYDKPEFLSRVAKHREFSKQAVRSLSEMRVHGAYLRPTAQHTAATVMDLDTTAPTTSPSPTGATPINGPGEPGPLAGQTDPAAPGGASPYNGAAPFGTPVVPNGGVAHGTPVAISATPGAAVDQAALEHLSPQTLAFRRQVQASLLQITSAKAKVPVCKGCGEAFESREIAEQAHGKHGCGSREDGTSGYKMTPEDEAW